MARLWTRSWGQSRKQDSLPAQGTNWRTGAGRSQSLGTSPSNSSVSRNQSRLRSTFSQMSLIGMRKNLRKTWLLRSQGGVQVGGMNAHPCCVDPGGFHGPPTPHSEGSAQCSSGKAGQLTCQLPWGGVPLPALTPHFCLSQCRTDQGNSTFILFLGWEYTSLTAGKDIDNWHLLCGWSRSNQGLLLIWGSVLVLSHMLPTYITLHKLLNCTSGFSSIHWN